MDGPLPEVPVEEMAADAPLLPLPDVLNPNITSHADGDLDDAAGAAAAAAATTTSEENAAGEHGQEEEEEQQQQQQEEDDDNNADNGDDRARRGDRQRPPLLAEAGIGGDLDAHVNPLSDPTLAPADIGAAVPPSPLMVRSFLRQKKTLQLTRPPCMAILALSD